jgi:hypothetical protein
MNRDASPANGQGSTDSGYTEKFPPTSGRVMGVVAVVLCAAVVCYSLLDGNGSFKAPLAWGAAFAGILAYAALLRPAVRVGNDQLVLRNMLDTNAIPLAAIDAVAVRQVLAVRAGEKRFVSPAIGTSFMRTIRPKVGRDGEVELTYPDYVRDRILHLSDGARRRLGDAEPPPVTRTWAWLELAALGLSLAGLVVSIVAR